MTCRHYYPKTRWQKYGPRTIAAIVIFVTGLGAGWLAFHVKPEPPRPEEPIPAGYNIQVTDGRGERYWTNQWAFDDQHKCVIFVDHKSQRQVVCGNFKLNNISDLPKQI